MSRYLDKVTTQTSQHKNEVTDQTPKSKDEVTAKPKVRSLYRIM